MQPPSRILLRDLLRVIAIGQSQEHEKLRLSPLALEVYADGCNLTILFQIAQPMPTLDNQHPRIRTLDRVEVTMTDGRSTEYTGLLGERGSSSSPDFWQGRGHWVCTPTLNPVAHRLRIEIPIVQWLYMEETEQGNMRRVPGETTHGPWNFSVQIPAAET